MTKNNFPIYLSLATIFGVLIGVFMNGNNSKFSLSSNTQNEAKIRRLMDYIDQNYVDTINTNKKKKYKTKEVSFKISKKVR